MSAFNTVKAKTNCPSCGACCIFEAQFKYGHTRQLSYELGDSLKWGGNDIGLSSVRRVTVEAIGGECPSCGVDMLEFDLIIEENVLKKLVGIGARRESESALGYTVLEE